MAEAAQRNNERKKRKNESANNSAKETIICRPRKCFYMSNPLVRSGANGPN